MKITIITVSYNCEDTIRETIESVMAQSYVDIEYIVIDGASKDRTLDIIDEYETDIDVIVSEPDEGIYDAMNKGLKRASGEVVGFLNADDHYTSDGVIKSIAEKFEKTKCDMTFADAQFEDRKNPNKIVRRYSSAHFKTENIGWGWMPAHPTMFLKKELYEKHGFFKKKFKIAGDFDFIARLFKEEKIRYEYIPQVMVNMKTGGVSNRGIVNKVKLNMEVLQACRDNGYRTNIIRICSKYLFKAFEYIKK